MDPSRPSEGVRDPVDRCRRLTTKVRTGCKTCKIRRIKCDESKPSCHRCVSTGRSCGGYNLATTPGRKIQCAFSSSDGTAAENRALYMFRNKIASLICSSLDADFWTYDLLQAAGAYKTIQYAVAGLAMAYQVSIIADRTDQSATDFVLAQYSKSINSLRQYLGKTKFRSRNQQVVVLITTLLLIYICTAQELPAEACTHLRSGLALLHEWKLGTAEDIAIAENRPPVVKFLLTTFTQLDTQARMMIEAVGRHWCKPWSPHHVLLDGWGDSHLEPITNAFAQLETLHNKAVQEEELFCSASDEGHYHPQALFDLQCQLNMWDCGFEKYLWDCHSPPGLIRELRMRRTVAGVTWGLQNRREPLSQRKAYQKIVDLALLTIQDSAYEEERIAFSPAGGLVEALYFVATNCADRDINEQAIGLLQRYPLIQGLWKSTSAAKMAALTWDSESSETGIIYL